MSPPPAGRGWGAGFFDRRGASRKKADLDLSWGGVSVVGNVRANNEDRFFIDPVGRFFLVADGMGGQSAGEKASALAAELVPRQLERVMDFTRDDLTQVQAALNSAVAHANTEIMAQSSLNPEYHNMGTTLALLVRAGGSFHALGVGDSPIYLCRGGKLEKLTSDHSLTQALLDAGTITPTEALTHRYRNVLYRYLGTKEGGASNDVRSVDLQSGDRFAICSDGALDGLNESGLREVLLRASEPQKAAEEIVSGALAGGSRDNVTAVVVFVGSTETE